MEKFKTNYSNLHEKITSFVQLLSQNLQPKGSLPDLDLIPKILPVDDGDLQRNNVKEVVQKFTLVAVLMATIREFIEPFLAASVSIDHQQNEIKRLIGKCQSSLSKVVVDGTTVALEVTSCGMSGYNQSDYCDNNIARIFQKLAILDKTIREGPKQNKC
jgi:hypothetical protein